jgi:hypothetical protein
MIDNMTVKYIYIGKLHILQFLKQVKLIKYFY